MGRFTSVQGFADNNSNNRSITYDQAKGNTDVKTNNGDDNNNNSNNKKLVTEKVVNPYGSTSGAGSGEFHVYRHARARERARWNALDLEDKKRKEDLEFRASLDDDRKQRETKASKNRKKRQREKEAKRRKKVMKAAGIDVQQPSTTKTSRGNEEEEEEFTYIPVAPQQQQQQQHEEQEEKKESSSNESQSSAVGPSSDSDLVIPNDGSFLEMMKRKLQAEIGQNQQQNATNPKPTNTNEQGGSVGDETMIQAKAAGGESEESDEEGPALPPKPSAK
jgi:hypothetical protein